MRFYGQFSPPQDQLLYQTYFQGLRGGVFMECGAFDGVTESSCYFFEESMEWTGVNIEAAQPAFDRLRINRPNAINIHAGLSSRSGIAQFKHAVHPVHGDLFGNGSFSHHQNHLDDLVAQGCEFAHFYTPLLTYRDVTHDLQMSRLDLFVLDVEGHEMDVISGMEGAKVLPRVFCIEYGHIDIPLLDSKMKTLGYRKDRLLHNNLVYLKSE